MASPSPALRQGDDTSDSKFQGPDINQWAESSADEILAQMGTRKSGLTEKEASSRLSEHGPNVLRLGKKQLYKKFLVQLRNLFNVLLLLAAVLSLASGMASNDPSSMELGIVLFIVVIVNVLFSIFQERRAERTMEAIRELVPTNSKVMRDGRRVLVPLSEIVPGDLVDLEEGDRVPADARVIESYGLSVDNSPLTGESEAQARSSDPEMMIRRHDPTSVKNLVFAGTTVLSGNGRVVVLATGTSTQFGQIVSIAHEVEEPLSPLQMELNRTAKLNFLVAIVVGLLFLAVAILYLHLPLSTSLLFMIGVMVSLVPEGFQVTVTLALALSSMSMARRNVVVKRLSAVETLGSATVICVDKTGTITEGQMTARRIWVGGSTYEVTGEGYDPNGMITLDGSEAKVTNLTDLRSLLQACVLNNNASLTPPIGPNDRWKAIGDPTEAALLVLASKSDTQPKDLTESRPRIGLIPFDTTRKMMSSINRVNDNETLVCAKGAGAEVLGRCTKAYWKGAEVPLTEATRKSILDKMDAFAFEAFRVIAFAERRLPGTPIDLTSGNIETDLTFVGLVALHDPPRAEAPEAVRRARGAGIRVIMLTGDHELTARSIAQRVGIITDHGAVVTGSQLEGLSDERLSETLEGPELVFARITAGQKHRIVKLLRSQGEVVAVTGDGVNDVPALLEADIGVAMGASGTDVAREAGDMVLLDDNFASIVGSIEEGRAAFDNLKKFLVYVFTHNWAELVAFIAFVLLQTPLPLAVVQVLAIDLFLEIPPSLSLTLDPPDKDTMDRPPRSRSVRIFDARSLSRTLFMGVIIGVAALFWCFNIWSRNGWHLGMDTVPNTTAYLAGTTAMMIGIMAGQIGTLIIVRSDVRSRFSLFGSKNKWVLRALLIEITILLAIVYLPILQSIFRTAPIPPLDWLLIYSIVPVLLVAEVLRRVFTRLVHNHGIVH